MASDFLYQNAPLIEVITELHWSLQPLIAIPNAAIDPHFAILSSKFTELARETGFVHVERLLPEQIPLEMMPHRAVFRFRRAAETWPLFQVGPGVFTANIVPPYQGWGDFRQSISSGLDLLLASYPLRPSYFRIEKLELRYIDGFTKRHASPNTFRSYGISYHWR
jgi:uncharacterized protein (TIGR04255 family)